MKAILISYSQAHEERILAILDRLNLRGFTSWDETKGRGTTNGEPHLGSHAWPALNGTMIVIAPAEKAPSLLRDLRALDAEKPALGLRAFQWAIEESV